MKFVFVVPSLAYGGAERVVSILASQLTKIGHKVTILIYFKTDSEYEVENKVKKVYLANDCEKSYNNMNYFKRLLGIRKIMKYENPDYVIPFLSHVCIQTCVALFSTRFKIIQTVRNDPRNLPKGKIHRFLRDLFIKHSYKTIVQNDIQKQYFDKRIYNKIFVLPNPVRDDLFSIESSRTKEEKTVIASAGRLNKQKNFFMLINAFEKVLKDYNNLELRIYGDGELKESLQNYIDEKGLFKNIKLMGRTNDMKEMFKNIDFYVLSSDFEGMPNSLMEAMAAGIPCVSTNCPTGPADLIEDGKTGFLVPVNDSDLMSKAIKKMLESDSDKIGKSAQNFIKTNFSPEKIVQQFIEICKI